YARAADQLGIDILENCEVTGFLKKGDTVTGIQTTRGDISAPKIGVAVAGSTSEVLRKAGVENLPIESHVLQAFVSEALKPVLNTVVIGAGGHFYMSQSDKGGLVYGGELDKYNSYAQRGNLPIVEDVHTMMLALCPQFAKLRLLRHWGGIMDMSMDGSPIITKGPLPGLYLNAGWCYGGFKATPASGWCFAHTIANDAPHALNAPFTLDRFNTGYTIDEGGSGPFTKLQ
ncbi:MAG: FAD-dependent oxidoreductase, partial [Hyphomicrobiales bacterium]